MMRRGLAPAVLLCTVAVVVVHLALPVGAAKFACGARGREGASSRCQSIVGYVPRNATTIAGVMSLFQVRSLRSVLAANGLPLYAPGSSPVPAGATLRVRFACACSAGRGASDRWPVYKVRPGDTLDAIARDVFGEVVAFEEIAAANNISDPGSVEAGRRVYIPLPCSCDEVDGDRVVHYAHVAAAGSSMAAIAAEFGTTEETLVKLNAITDPNSLVAGQVLDVPLRVCSSYISTASMDYGLSVPTGSYILTANNCVLCSCSSSSWQLDCQPTKGISTSVCPTATCTGNLTLGSSSPGSSACESKTCDYGGYTGKNSSFSILTNLTTLSACNNAGGAPQSQQEASASSSLLKPGMQWPSVLAVSISVMSMRIPGFLL